MIGNPSSRRVVAPRSGPYGKRPRVAIPATLAAMPAYTLGMLAPVPFFYAAAKLQTRKLWLITAVYAPIWLAAWIIVVSSPQDSSLAGVGGFLFIGLAGIGTAHAFAMRASLARRSGEEFGRALPQPGTAVPAVHPAPDPTAAQLQAALAALKSCVATHAAAFPPACRQLLDETVTQLDEVVAFVAGGGHADESLLSVQAILTDYVPTSVNTYLRLPREFALSHRNADGKTAADELELQLRLLRDAAHEAADALYADDAQRLQVQSTFLQDKFGKSELDLA